MTNTDTGETAIATFDDNTRVYLEAWSGGAHPAGPWGMVRLRFEKAGITDTREYTPIEAREVAILSRLSEIRDLLAVIAKK